mgnify:CR=1 FL=1
MAKPERISVAYFMKHHVKHSVRNVFLVILIVSVQACGLLYSQNPGPGPTRQSSLEAYSKGDYEKAYNQFSELLSAYPKDPLYLYYTGVCLVQLRREPPRAISLLKQAKPTPVQLRNVPTDVTFWLGRAQQMNGNFEDAITTFEEFTSQAGKKTAREMMVPEYIEQCRQKSGSITKEPSKVITTDQIIAPLSETVPENSVTEITPVRQSARTELPAKSDSVTGISKDYEMLLADALEYQARAD